MSAPPCWCSRPAASRGLAVVLLSFVFSCVSVMPMETTVSAASPAVVTRGVTYDASALARVGVPATETRLASSRQVAGLREGAASPSFEAHVAPTTSPRSFVATNTADDVLRLGTQESWGNPGTLARHFRDHGADFAATSADDYARQASEFLQQPGTLTKIDADGVIRVYDPAANTFGAYNPNGTTRTFFKPSSPTYWDGQPGSAPAG